jgi:A/G-specific adenine glycosylase
MRRALLAWYRERGRALPIRVGREPWAVLVAEVMAQQTQVSRVGPAWASFLSAWPRPADLATAPTAEVVRAWAGLGYNRRALYLQRAARTIAEHHAGVVPSTVAELEALPGVGPYTARAVAAIAFGLPVAAVDANVRRVVSRLISPVAVQEAREAGLAGEPSGRAVGLRPADVQAHADRLVDPRDPGDWAHAMMDVGATLCRPRRAACGSCPLARWCASAGRVVAAASMDGAMSVAPAFEATSRWLRGRIVARLRIAEGDGWTRLDRPIGSHDLEAVARALRSLERDGLLERRPDGAVRLPSVAP